MNGDCNQKEETGKVVVITGGNSGVGFALAQRLLTLEITLTICLACRNVTKAEKAKAKLEEEFRGAKVDILQLDTSSLASVSEAAKKLQQRYRQIDYLYLNAGIMPETAVNWKYLLWCLFHPVHLLDALSTGEGLLKMKDSDTKDGLKLIFATNLFGQFLLVRKLEDFLCEKGCHIIWTSSSNARKKYFSMDDIQDKKGNKGFLLLQDEFEEEFRGAKVDILQLDTSSLASVSEAAKKLQQRKQPYSSSKHGINLISNAFNDRLKDKEVYSHVICPGFSITGMTSPMLGDFLWSLLYPLFVLLRLFIPIMCVTPWNSAEALVWLFQTDASEVNPALLHTSQISFLGKGYVKSKKIEFYSHEPRLLYKRLVALQTTLEGTDRMD